jgi:geranylgeranyl pyrophosphate synthase
MKNFSTIVKKYAMPGGLAKYKTLIDKSQNITEELFPKNISDKHHLNDYLKLTSISKNIQNNTQQASQSVTEGILKPCWDLLERGGKKWRPMFGLMIADYFGLNLQHNKNKQLYQILELTELIHNTSLIIDDIQDSSEQRRGKPCVNKIYGNDIALNASLSMLYFPVYKFISDLESESLRAEISYCYLQEISAMLLGQNWDLEMKIGRRIPTVSNYKDMVLCKTGVCLRMGVKFLQILINSSEKGKYSQFNKEIFDEFVDIADNLCIAFQIKDDILNLLPSELSKGKGYVGEDIFEGKLTLIVLHTLNNKMCSHKNRLKEILTMKVKDDKIINEAIDILKENGSIDYATHVMNYHVDLVMEKCEKLGKLNYSKGVERYNMEVSNNISELVDYLVERNL